MTGPTDNPFEDPAFQAYARRCREELQPMIENSAVGLSIVPPTSDAVDVKFAVELGFMILLDKPIIAVVPPGTKVGLKLAKVADEIVEGDIDDPTMQKRLMAAITRIQQRHR